MDRKDGTREQLSVGEKDANEGMSKQASKGGRDANEGMSIYQSAAHCEGGRGGRAGKGRAEDVLSSIIPKFGGSGILDAAAENGGASRERGVKTKEDMSPICLLLLSVILPVWGHRCVGGAVWFEVRS